MAAPRALVPTSPRWLARPIAPLSLLPARAIPLAAHAAAVTLVGLAAEHFIRAATNQALASLGRARSRHAARAIVTEITVVERFRRD